MSRLMISAAGEEVLITDDEIGRERSIYRRRELIVAKITAYEWFFGSWLGMQPRLALEEVCPVLHLDPDWVRERVRAHPDSAPTRYRMPPGYRFAELWDDQCPECEGAGRIDGEVCLSCDGLGTKRRDRTRRKPGEMLAEVEERPAAAAPSRLEKTRELLASFERGPRATPSRDEEIERAFRLGFDLLGDADAGIVLDDGTAAK